MDWDQNEELVEQILRTGMYAKLYDEETTYGYLTYLTYRVEETLFTWKRKAMWTGFGPTSHGRNISPFCGGKNIAPGSPKGVAQHRDGFPCLRI